MNLKNNFMLRAIELSINSAHNAGGPFGCVIVKDDKIIDQRTGRLCPRNKNKFLKLENQAQRTECSFIYEQGIVDETGAGGCGIFDNEWLGCGENQHYNCDCTKCLDD